MPCSTFRSETPITEAGPRGSISVGIQCLGDEACAAGRYPEAAVMFETMSLDDYSEFLALPAYELID